MRRPVHSSIQATPGQATRRRSAISAFLLTLGLIAAVPAAGQPAPAESGAGSASPAPAASPAAESRVPAGTPRMSGTGWFGHDSRLSVPPFNDDFTGLDLSALTAEARETFLQRANSEPCPCAQSGCERHTLAFCFKVDPECPVARRHLVRMAAGLAPPKP